PNTPFFTVTQWNVKFNASSVARNARTPIEIVSGTTALSRAAMLLLLLQVDRVNLCTRRANAQESGRKCLNPGIRTSGRGRTTRTPATDLLAVKRWGTVKGGQRRGTRALAVGLAGARAAPTAPAEAVNRAGPGFVPVTVARGVDASSLQLAGQDPLVTSRDVSGATVLQFDKRALGLTADTR